MDLADIWSDYGLDGLQAGIDTLFPHYEISLDELFARILQGDVIGALTGFCKDVMGSMTGSLAGLKNIFIWLLVLGVLSAMMNHFIEVFDQHQVADLSFYFMYLLMTAILLRCFAQAATTAVATMENIVLFIKMMVPTYLMAVGLSAGGITLSSYYQLLLLLIYGVEKVLLGVLVPVIYSYCLLAVVNGIWVEERLSLLIELIEKAVGWVLKASIGVVTGVSVFQSVITPVLDSVKTSALQKAVSAIPGIGGAADGVVDLVIGSAVVVKNSVGVVILILLLLLCAAPLVKIFCTAVLLKCAAALMGVVSDKRITACANRTGDAGMLLFRTVGTALLMFLITIALVASSTNRGF